MAARAPPRRPWRFALCASPDLDGDDDVDLIDFASFQYCFSGANVSPVYPGARQPTWIRTPDVDVSDFTVFQACFQRWRTSRRRAVDRTQLQGSGCPG